MKKLLSVFILLSLNLGAEASGVVPVIEGGTQTGAKGGTCSVSLVPRHSDPSTYVIHYKNKHLNVHFKSGDAEDFPPIKVGEVGGQVKGFYEEYLPGASLGFCDYSPAEKFHAHIQVDLEEGRARVWAKKCYERVFLSCKGTGLFKCKNHQLTCESVE